MGLEDHIYSKVRCKEVEFYIQEIENSITKDSTTKPSGNIIKTE